MVRTERGDEAGDATAYRPVSMLAVAAALAGVASSLALTTPMLWALPLVGVGLALAGLADVARPGAEKAGRMLALAGLALSVGFGAQAVTSAIVSRRIVEARAVATANAWIDAIHQGRLADARAMANSEVRGELGLPPHPDHVPGEDDATHHDAAFRAVPAVAAIDGCGPAAAREARCTGPDALATDAWGVTVRLAPCPRGRDVEIALQLTPSLAREGAGRVERWIIVKADVVP
jgi:hypothetical protein